MADWRIACDGDTLAWQRRSRSGIDAGTQSISGPEPLALVHALAAVLDGRARPGDGLRMALGSHYMRVAALSWPQQRLANAEQHALLRQRWQARLDDVSDWWLGVEGSGTVRLATAMRHDLLTALEGKLTDHRIRARACLPATALALQSKDLPADGRITVIEGSRETVITLSGGRLAGLISSWRAPATPQATTASGGGSVRYDDGPRHWLTRL